MDTVHIEVAGVRRVGLRFENFPDALHDDLKQQIEALGAELLARIYAATPAASGRLLGQERLRIFDDGNRIKAYVDIAGEKGSQDFAKAAALEYGAHGKVRVKAHPMQLDHLWSEKLNEPLTVLVAAFSRTANIEEVRFERGPLEQMQPEILARLNAVVEKDVAEANA